MKALVLGSAGQLGRELCARLGPDLAWAGGRGDLDVTDSAAVLGLLERVRPEVVYNATAYNKVDAAESDRARAFAVNAEAPGALAKAVRSTGAALVHVSTDYVFDGASRRPYREEDRPSPLSVYGASKLAGERLVLDSGAEALVVRTSGVLGRGGSGQKGGSFVERILARARSGEPLRVVADQVFAPTIAGDLAAALVALAGKGARGLFHFTNSGSCTWHELALATLAAAGLERPIEAVTTESLRLAARRPAYSVLDSSRAKALGVPPGRPWRDALPELIAFSGAAATAAR